MDTWAVSRDLLNVVLIDAVFMGLWFAAAYGGRGENALAMRPFAALGAWLMYAAMLIIGWEAHRDATAFAVRIAGGVALSYDTWDYIVSVAARARIQRKAMTFEAFCAREDERAMRKGYAHAVRKTRRTQLQDASNMIASARIQRYANEHLSPVLATTEDVTVMGFRMLEDNRIECLDCGWKSPKSYPNMRAAQSAHAGHCAGASHRNALVATIDA